MMDCSEVLSLIPAYCSGELDDEQRRQVEEHLASCPTCRHEVDREKSLRKALSGQASDDPPPDYWDGFNTGLRARIRGTVGVLWGLGCLPGCAAGLIISVVLGGLTLGLAAAFPAVALPNWAGFAGFIGVLIAVLGVSVALMLLYKRADRSVSANLGQDVSVLKRLIRGKPSYRLAFLIVSVLCSMGLSAFVASMSAGIAERVLMSARVVLGTVVFLTMGLSCEIELVRYIRSEGGRPRPLRISRALMFLAFAALMGLNLWNMHISETMYAPSDVKRKAETAYAAGDADSAIAMLRSCINEQSDLPRVLDCYQFLGQIYKEKGQPVRARAIYMEGIQVYERLLAHPHYTYTTSDRSSMAFHASELYEGLGNERKVDELHRLMDRLNQEPGF